MHTSCSPDVAFTLTGSWGKQLSLLRSLVSSLIFDEDTVVSGTMNNTAIACAHRWYDICDLVVVCPTLQPAISTQTC